MIEKFKKIFEGLTIAYGQYQKGEKDDNGKHQFGVRTPLRFLIEGVFDERGTDKGLNAIERNERK